SAPPLRPAATGSTFRFAGIAACGNRRADETAQHVEHDHAIKPGPRGQHSETDEHEPERRHLERLAIEPPAEAVETGRSETPEPREREQRAKQHAGSESERERGRAHELEPTRPMRRRKSARC